MCVLATDLAVAGTPALGAAEASLADAGFRVAVEVLPAGESAKTVEEAERLWAAFAEQALDRSGVVVALGGGAVGDVAGFCAATWMRGVPWIVVPTTLLAMADSAVGGKTGVNLAAGKNLVGAFHPPALVVADLGTLATLPGRELRSGFAEIVKCSVLDDRARLASLRRDAARLLARDAEALRDAVGFAVGVKAALVRDDPHDLAGVRALLNLGHTAAHALEAESGYGTMLHGEAVAVGLVVALRVAVARGLCGADLLGATAETLEAFGLPTSLPPGARPDEVLARTRLDKKRASGARRMVLPLAAGGAELATVADDELLAALVSSRAPS